LNKVSPRSSSFWKALPREKGLFNPRQAQAGLDSPFELDHRLNIRQLLFSRFDEPDTTLADAADLQFTAFARRCKLLGI
jgi:hypothetical protein